MCLSLILAAAYMVASMMFSYLEGAKIEAENAVHLALTKKDLRFCRSNPSNGSSQTLSYTCAGPSYDNFTEQLHAYALAKNCSSWGRREFPFPPNATVLIMGNSHTRQVCESLRCQYRSEIASSTQRPDPFGGSKNLPSTWVFKNNATAMIVSNTPYVYHKTQWANSLKSLLGRPLSSFDAIVMGRFNGIENTSNFGRGLMNFSLAHPEYFDSRFTTPPIERLADVYSGPIIALPMFAVYGQDVKSNAQRARDKWERSANRTNIFIVETRKHIQAIGNECGSDSLYEIGTCLHSVADNNGGRDPKDMHRCTGKEGGHPDLVVWDMIEQLREVLA